MVTWVVVGGGAAGCVVAARLSERSGDAVVLLEAGPDHGEAAVVDDVGPYLADAARVRSDVSTRRGGGVTSEYLRGHGLAGGSLINGGVVTDPGSPSEHRLPLQPPWADGAVGAALLATDRGARRVALIRRNDRRVTAADAYLRPVLDRRNLTVRTDTVVRRVALDGRRVRGVVTEDGELIAGDRVVLCAGAFHTPTILLRSGADTPGIGEGLEDHPAVTITLGLRADQVDPTVPAISVAADHPAHQLLALNHLPGRADLGALVVALTEPQSRGTVRLPDLDGPPVIDINHLGDAHELDLLARAVSDTIDLLEQPAWDAVVEEAFVDDRGTPLAALATGREAIEGWIVEHTGGYFHAASTCRDGVVTDGGVLRGYSGLYVADASALPGLPRHDPYVHVVSRADHLATHWP